MFPEGRCGPGICWGVGAVCWRPVVWASPCGSRCPAGWLYQAIFALSGDITGVLVVYRILLTVLCDCPAMVPSAKLACLGFSFFVFRVAILSPARRVLQEEPSLSWISAAGKDTQKESDRSFFRKWATCPEGAWGRTLKVWCPARGRSGRRGRALPLLCSAAFLPACDSGALSSALYESASHVKCRISARGSGRS